MRKRVDTTPIFRRQYKRLVSKFPAVEQVVDELITRLENGELPGDTVANVAAFVRKVRLPNPSARRGKRGGFRALYYIPSETDILLICIYSKTDQADISDVELRRILSRLN